MTNKSILIIGNKKWPSLESIYLKYLRLKFSEVNIFNIDDYCSFNLFFRIRRKFKDQSVFKNLNDELLKYAVKHKPDIIWVFKGVEIYLSTLAKLKELNIKLANFNADNPFHRVFSSNGGKSIEKAIPYYDLHFTYSKKIFESLSKEYNMNTILLPFGHELSESEFELACQEKEIIKACFIGNPDKWRKKQIKYLVNKGIKIDVYGHGWNNWLEPNENISIFGALYELEFWKVLRKYRVQINLFRPYNEGSHNMRTFEIPAVGGIQLAPNNSENKLYFDENQEIFLYNDLDDLFKKYELLIKLDSITTESYRKKAIQRSIADNYSYKSRAEVVFRTFQNL
jgi:spore maturation protein CgeB